MKEPKIQINKSLYNEILCYFGGDNSADRERRIRDGINEDLDARIRRDYYTQYKTAPTDEQKEKARQQYLEARGIPKSFRW